ncbi:hypothetical protein BD626DRAFT_84511 [Schizophyllum amplum]|uniref:Uncharacterized protein n=1 Tax=Schizophyllum amplum TaxID=97359 RepID=A0A550C912_9AGAR|nr:hypothetical protein BD626DRAFT_84511 [Auriculariopsis ampla]
MCKSLHTYMTIRSRLCRAFTMSRNDAKRRRPRSELRARATRRGGDVTSPSSLASSLVVVLAGDRHGRPSCSLPISTLLPRANVGALGSRVCPLGCSSCDIANEKFQHVRLYVLDLRRRSCPMNYLSSFQWLSEPGTVPLPNTPPLHGIDKCARSTGMRPLALTSSIICRSGSSGGRCVNVNDN